VPLCRTHHRELHRHCDERVWWGQLSIDPLLTASALWGQTHPAIAAQDLEQRRRPLPASVMALDCAPGEMPSAWADSRNGDGALEDGEDYKAFEATVMADYAAQSAVERELVLRLASLLWRVRRATTMETGLFSRSRPGTCLISGGNAIRKQNLIRRFFPSTDLNEGLESNSEHAWSGLTLEFRALGFLLLIPVL
jgi:hypothetical protein